MHGSVHSYGNAKRMIQELAACYAMQHGVRSVNFLVPNTFGPGDHTDPNKTHALNGMIIRMLKAHRAGEERFEIWGTGRPVREWAYIDDVAEILVRGLRLEADLTYPVNIAQNHGYSIAETAGHIARAVGFGVIKDRLPFVRTSKGGLRRTADFHAFWEAVLAGLLILGAIVLVCTNYKEVREINIFAVVLLVQSLPFIAAVGLALIERTRLNDFAYWHSIEARVARMLPIMRRSSAAGSMAEAPRPVPTQNPGELVQ